MRTFFTVEGGYGEFSNFTLPTLKAFLDAVIRMRLPTINNLLHVLYDAPKCLFCPRTQDLLVSQKSTQRHFFPTLPPLSPVIFGTATVVAFVLLRILGSASIVIHSVKQRLLRNRPGSDAATSSDLLRERLQTAFTRANQLH